MIILRTHIKLWKLYVAIENEEDILSDAYLEGTVVPRIADKWHDVGLELDIPDERLKIIRHLTDPSGEKCKAMLSKWLERKMIDPDDRKQNPTWGNMYNAMCALDMNRAAEEMKEELAQMQVPH